MHIVIISCHAYQDAWQPFLELLKHFWPDCPYSLDFYAENHVGEKWCSVLARVARARTEPLLVMQEDFFLTEPVRQDMVEHALKQLEIYSAGCVRLYPCPGADVPTDDDNYGLVSLNALYRISCQAAIWRPDYLAAVAEYANGTATDFELRGTPFSRTMHDPVLAWNREVTPWPMSYLCSAITRGQWTADAKKVCDERGIVVDWSKRSFMPTVK